MNADQNSVQFSPTGRLISVKTIHTGVRVISADQVETTIEPLETTSLVDISEMRTVPMRIDFTDDTVEVSPLLPAGKWDWFCLDNVLYHGRLLTVLWDKPGAKFHKGKGLRVFADGKEIAKSAELARVTGKL